MTHPKLEWWKSVRENPKFTPRMRRNGDILYGFIQVYRFPKTHGRLKLARAQSKKHDGLRRKSSRLSNFLKVNGLKRAGWYFTPHYKSVRGILRRSKSKSWVRKPKVKEYGGRHRLILGPRYDFFYRKYGPLGG